MHDMTEWETNISTVTINFRVQSVSLTCEFMKIRNPTRQTALNLQLRSTSETEKRTRSSRCPLARCGDQDRRQPGHSRQCQTWSGHSAGAHLSLENIAHMVTQHFDLQWHDITSYISRLGNYVSSSIKARVAGIKWHSWQSCTLTSAWFSRKLSNCVIFPPSDGGVVMMKLTMKRLILMKGMWSQII